MKHLFIFLALLSIHAAVQAQGVDSDYESLLSLFSPSEKEAAIQALANGECKFKGIPLYGKIQFVTSFPDIKIQFVENFPDIKVKFVTSFPDECGLWQVTESFPDFKVQVVTSFPDIKVKVVESFPGMD